MSETATLAEPPLKPGERLDVLIRRAISLKKRVNRLEEGAKAVKAELERLVRHEILDLFTEVGGAQNRTVDGVKCEVGTRVAGSLGKAPDEEAAVEHLRACGFLGAVETIVSLTFTEAERDKAKLIADTVSTFAGKEAAFERFVHHSTLAAFAAERLRDGKPVDLACLGLSSWREAKLSGRGLK